MDEDTHVRFGNVVHCTLAKALGGLIAVALTASGATFTITKLATDSHISALQLQNAMLDTRVRELQAEVQRRAPVTEISSAAVPNSGMTGKTDTLAISFKSPKANSEVSQFADVEYMIVGQMESGYQPVLFVRDPLGQYWSWGSAPKGVHSRVQIGIAVDSGKQFEIGVLITNQNVSLGKALRTLPPGAHYEAISVTRK